MNEIELLKLELDTIYKKLLFWTTVSGGSWVSAFQINKLWYYIPMILALVVFTVSFFCSIVTIKEIYKLQKEVQQRRRK